MVTSGQGPVTIVDDIVTETRHTVPSGSALVLPPNGPEEWEPTPLPGPPPPRPKREATSAIGNDEKEREWEPTHLPRMPRPVRTFDFPLAAGSTENAFDLAKNGGSLRLRVPETNELRLSQLSGIPEAIREGEGSLIVELVDDG